MLQNNGVYGERLGGLAARELTDVLFQRVERATNEPNG
jgi:hypothetical protein